MGRGGQGGYFGGVNLTPYPMDVQWSAVLAHTATRVVLILIVAFVMTRVIRRLTRRWVRRAEALPISLPRRQRLITSAHLVYSLGHYTIWPIALIMILSEFQINVGPLLASAGIAGLAIGFGAQTLVRDVISGLFLLFDDTIRVGHLITFQNETGSVEHIGLRLIRIRKLNGEVVMIPAGELRVFTNKSLGYARAVVEVGVAYEQDIEAVLPVMERVAREWMESHTELTLESDPTVQAITQFGDSSVMVRLMFKVVPGEQFDAERDLRRNIKAAFDEAGIEIPFPRRTLYIKNIP